MSIPSLQSNAPWDQRARVIINNALKLIVDASTTVAGLVRLATTTEATTGTATDIATTPAGVKAVIDALKAAANTWTAEQTISLSAAGDALSLVSSDAGAGEGPVIRATRASSSAAANDVIGSLRFVGNDDAGNGTNYAGLIARIVNPADGSENGRLIIRSLRAAADVDWFIEAGALRYSTQTQPSNAGEIAAVAYKVGANQVVGARKTGWALPTGTSSRATFNTATVTTEQLARVVKALIEDFEATNGHGLIGA